MTVPGLAAEHDRLRFRLCGLRGTSHGLARRLGFGRLPRGAWKLSFAHCETPQQRWRSSGRPVAPPTLSGARRCGHALGGLDHLAGGRVDSLGAGFSWNITFQLTIPNDLGEVRQG